MFPLISRRKFSQIEVIESHNVLVCINGRKNKLRVYYLSWLRNKILRGGDDVSNGIYLLFLSLCIFLSLSLFSLSLSLSLSLSSYLFFSHSHSHKHTLFPSHTHTLSLSLLLCSTFSVSPSLSHLYSMTVIVSAMALCQLVIWSIVFTIVWCSMVR